MLGCARKLLSLNLCSAGKTVVGLANGGSFILLGDFGSTSWQWWQAESGFLIKENKYISPKGIYQFKVNKIDMVNSLGHHANNYFC